MNRLALSQELCEKALERCGSNQMRALSYLFHSVYLGELHFASNHYLTSPSKLILFQKREKKPATELSLGLTVRWFTNELT